MRKRTKIPAFLALGLMAAPSAFAHGIADQERQRMLDGGFVEAMRVGTEHMLTGYDHLLFLFGAVLVLIRASRVLAFVTAFTIGHTITLLGATLLGFRANPFLIDAAIALTVLYVAIQNMGLFEKWGIRVPDLVLMVFFFGLVHGLGLSTRLQEMTIAADPAIVSKILAFNVGVELGQVIALTAMIGTVSIWRGTPVYSPAARVTNAVLVVASTALFSIQIHSYFS